MSTATYAFSAMIRLRFFSGLVNGANAITTIRYRVS